MEAAELDTLIEELETRVERLRALYEQYFMGIEKVPPHVVQKDVDRRLYTLRREQIRNTAKRFKLQTIIQRYNTFQQYWMRIMREIENGTYRRHVLRAERTVGLTDLLTAAERKRLGLPERDSESPNLLVPDSSNSERVADDAESGRAGVGADETPEAMGPESPLGYGQRSRVLSDVERDLSQALEDELDDLDTKRLYETGDELDDPLLSSMPPPAHNRRSSAKPVARSSARPSAGLRPKNSGAPPAPISRPQLAGSTLPLGAEKRPTTASDPGGIRRSLRPNRAAPDPSKPGGLKLPAQSAVAGRGLPPLQKGTTPRGAPAKIPSRPIIAVGGKPSPSAVDDEAPIPRRPPLPSPLERPSVDGGKQAIPPPAPQPGEANDQRPATGKTVAPVLPQRSPSLDRTLGATPHHQSARGERTAPVSSPDRRSEGLDRNRVEQLAEKLRAARKQTREESPVSVDALAKKLEMTTLELSKKHAGKRVDFDVVIKDGKAIVKPIIR